MFHCCGLQPVLWKHHVPVRTHTITANALPSDVAARLLEVGGLELGELSHMLWFSQSSSFNCPNPFTHIGSCAQDLSMW